MTRKSRARASSLFLMELILAILFFSAASAVCVQFFVRSHLLSRDSDNLSHGVNECSAVAEAVCVSDSISETAALLQSLYPEGSYPKTDAADKKAEISLYYDDSFHPCGKENCVFRLVLRLAETGGMLNADIRIHACALEADQKDAIYGLHVQHHIAGRTGYEKG